MLLERGRRSGSFEVGRGAEADEILDEGVRGAAPGRRPRTSARRASRTSAILPLDALRFVVPGRVGRRQRAADRASGELDEVVAARLDRPG